MGQFLFFVFVFCFFFCFFFCFDFVPFVGDPREWSGTSKPKPSREGGGGGSRRKGSGPSAPPVGIWSADLWNPKYASYVYKVTVAVDMLGNIIWICPLAPGTPADVLIWDGYGPSRTRGGFFDFKVGGHDGAYKGRIHVIVPLIGRKNGTLTTRQQCYPAPPPPCKLPGYRATISRVGGGAVAK